MTTQTQARPEFGKLYGITYDKYSKAPIVRTPRVLKVGIGIPKGRAIQVFLHNGKWNIRHGVWEGTKLVMKTVYRGGAVINGVVTPNTREAAEAWHNEHKKEAAVSNRPQKVPYFTFSRRVVVEEDGRTVEVFEPDFEAIEAHGDAPRRITIILTADQPWYEEYAWWTATELKCHGDGLLAERAVSAGSVKDPGWQEAKNAGERMFPYAPCYTGGCPHAGVDCKPHGTLKLQLASSLRLGATSYFATTGQVSCSQIFSSLTEITKDLAALGSVVTGVPLDLVLSSFKANHDGKASIQPCVSLELRGQAGGALLNMLAANAWTPAQIERETRQIEARPVVTYAAYAAEAEAEEETTSYPDAEVEYDDEPIDVPEVTVPVAATATTAKQDRIASQLRAVKAKSALFGSNEEMKEKFKALFLAVKTPDVVEKILAKHKRSVADLAWDDPATIAAYHDLQEAADPF